MGFEIACHAGQVRQESLITGSGLQSFLVNGPQHKDRVVACHFPQVAIQSPEKFNGVVIPGPAQIVGQRAQLF